MEWELIEQVLLWSAEPYNCTLICDALELTPCRPDLFRCPGSWPRTYFPRSIVHVHDRSCAQMTKCGHIYCASCILRYLGEGASEWRRCPMCFESVSRSHLKAVAIQSVTAVAEGETASLVLLQRYRVRRQTFSPPSSSHLHPVAEL